MISVIKRYLKTFLKSSNDIDEMESFLNSNVAGFFRSYALSLNDEQPPSENLIQLSLKAIELALKLDLRNNPSLFPPGEVPAPDVRAYANVYPGEHYRLLAAIVELVKPNLVVEIGTYRGISAISMKSRLEPEAKVITYDVLPWDQISESALDKSDFDSGLEQRVYDLAGKNVSGQEIEILKRADIIFVDAAKDRVMEKRFCSLFDRVEFEKTPIVIFDDIKMISMIELWRRIPYPKIDITSFGHWSGTGIVEWGKNYADEFKEQWFEFLK